MSEIQVNERIRFTSEISKDELKKLTSLHNSSQNWKNVEVTAQELADIIAQGYTIRGGIKDGGNDRAAVQKISWLFLDFDNQSVAKTLECPWSKYAAFWYYTPSYKPGINEKHRLAFQLERYLDGTNYETLYSVIIKNFYTGADNTTSAGCLFFGAHSPASVFMLNPDAKLPTEGLLAMADAGVIEESTEPVLSNDGGVRDRVLKHFARHIWQELCNSEDVDKLYCLHPHKFTKQDERGLGKWGGHRPEDKEKNYGTGFFVFWKNPAYPPVFQNQGECKLPNGNFIEYWHHYKNELYGKKWGSIEWKEDRNYNEYQKVCDDISDYFEVEKFDFSTAIKDVKKKREDKKEEVQKGLMSAMFEVMAEYCYILKGAKDNYIVYDIRDGYWSVKADALHTWKHCIKPALKIRGHEDLDDPKLGSFCVTFINNYSEFVSIKKSDFDEKVNTDWIPLSNGDYNWKTKEFVPGHNPKIYNQHRHTVEYTADYTPPDEFLEWLEWSYKNENTRKGVIDWLTLNVLGIAGLTNKMMCFWGKPGTGKSVVLNLIGNLLNQHCIAIQANKLEINDNRFIFQNIDGVHAIIIDEFSTNNIGWNNLKKIAGTFRPFIEIEKKGLSSYTTKFLGAVTTSSQDMFRLPNSDDGGIRRRVVTVQHTESMLNEKYKNIDVRMAEISTRQNIFMWLLHQDGVTALENFKKFAESEECKNNLLDILQQNDDVLQFMNERLIFTNNASDVVSNTELQAVYETFLEVEMNLHLSERDKGRINKITQYIREKASIKDNNFNWTFAPEKGKDSKVSINGKQVRGFKGIVIKTSCDAGVL